ncbi:hypothetical protein I3760_11G016400 [Carya illinoinensis]|nr:hypothetical protein I3760_11G016400 [Carya illinoinensis]
MLLHLDMAGEVMKTHDITFSNRPRTTTADILFIGFASYGEYWRQARRICILELLSLRRVIRESCLKQNYVNLSEMFFTTSNNIVSRVHLGRTRRVMVLFTSFSARDFFPSLGWIDVLTGLIPSLKAIVREIDPLLDQVIEEHRKVRVDDHGQPNKKDFVDTLVQLQEEGMRDYDFLFQQFNDMFVGGCETSSTITEWLMGELIKKSKHYEESTRRETSTRVKFGGYYIPSETRVYVNVWAIQRDPTVWERPEEFLPKRFIDNAIDFKGQDFEFLPFGGGRRGCPWLTFGLTSVEYVIANMLCWFDWRLPIASIKGQDVGMGEVYGLTVARKIPLHLVPAILHSP